MKPFILILIFAVLFYILWLNGLMVVSVKRSLTFIGHRRAGCWGAVFTGCTGYTKRSLKLTAGIQYLFTFENNVDTGNVTVELSKGKQPVATFEQGGSTHAIIAEKGLYTITTRFKSASGKYELKWKKDEI